MKYFLYKRKRSELGEIFNLLYRTNNKDLLENYFPNPRGIVWHDSLFSITDLTSKEYPFVSVSRAHARKLFPKAF